MTDIQQLRLIAEQLLIVAQERECSVASEPPAAEGESRKVQRKTSDDPISFADPDTLACLAFGLYETRRLRDRHFKNDLFADPAWDILLDLYVQKSAGKRVSITSACIASGAPPTTGLRWVSLLIAEGLVIREDDIVDRRRAFLRLSKAGETAVQRALIDSLSYLKNAAGCAFAFWKRQI